MRYLIVLGCLLITTTCFSQNFSKDISTAKAAYASHKLEDAHFALLQALQEVDIIVGKEVLALLPSKMESYSVNPAEDNVMSNAGLIGSTIHRTYGPNDAVGISIIGNSPLISTLNAFLNTPLLGGMVSRGGNNKIIKIEGYKGQLTMADNGNGQSNYTIQIPLGSSLITFEAKNATEGQVITWANTVPLENIARLIQ